MSLVTRSGGIYPSPMSLVTPRNLKRAYDLVRATPAVVRKVSTGYKRTLQRLRSSKPTYKKARTGRSSGRPSISKGPNIASGSSTGVYKHSHKLSKGNQSTLKGLSLNRITYYAQTSFASGQGAQSVNTVGTYFPTSVIATMFNNTGTIGSNTSPNLFIHSVKAKHYFTNICNATIQIMLYNITVKSGISGSTPMDPYTLWTQGLTNETASSVATQVDQVPTASNQFNKFFKIRRRSRVFLKPGETYIHFVSIQPRMWLNYEVPNEQLIVPRLSEFLMVVCHGCDVEKDSTAPNNCNLASSDVGHVSQIIYTSQFRNKLSDTSNTVGSNLPTLATPQVKKLIKKR